MIATELPDPLAVLPSEPKSRQRQRLQSIGWALLAFHLQRVDPDDSHRQAGLVGTVCGLRSPGMPLPLDNW